ncbi:MAG: D-glycerate dehydrogenase [Clostridia bacterium]|nr:D-glycerate dehydrogenase [Clostridia bacterium]
MKKVLITEPIPQAGIDLLKEHFDVTVNTSGHSMTKEEMIREFNKYDGIGTSLLNPIDYDVIESCPNVQIMANFAVGFNNIDIEAAVKRNLIVTNTPDVLSDTTAETAWALLFAVARRIVEADRYVRDGKWQKFSTNLFLGMDVFNKTLGIIGAGNIGRRFAEKARGYHMDILYYNRHRDFEFEKQYNAKYVAFDELLSNSDFVSIHVPLNEETRHLIGAEELALMKDNAILINTSRGPVVDEKALIKALQEKQLYGAGLDVFEDEPHVPEALLQMDNVVLLPHIGSSTKETRERMSLLVAHNLINVLEGKAPVTPVFK